MELFRNDHPDLADCQGSIALCLKVKALITTMNSRIPCEALKPNNTMWKVKTLLKRLA